MREYKNLWSIKGFLQYHSGKRSHASSLKALHSFLEYEEAVFLIKLLRHVRVGVVFVEELDGMEAATVNVEVNVAAVKIGGAGFPHLHLGVHLLDGFPDGLADAPALYTDLHIEKRQLALFF